MEFCHNFVVTTTVQGAMLVSSKPSTIAVVKYVTVLCLTSHKNLSHFTPPMYKHGLDYFPIWKVTHTRGDASCVCSLVLQNVLTDIYEALQNLSIPTFNYLKTHEINTN
jgi:hypothetical protein